MSKISEDAADAFERGTTFKRGNTRVVLEDGEWVMRLHGNPIAFRGENTRDIRIDPCGWLSVTTKSRLNALSGVSIVQRNYSWYLNELPWDGSKVNPKEMLAIALKCNNTQT